MDNSDKDNLSIQIRELFGSWTSPIHKARIVNTPLTGQRKMDAQNTLTQILLGSERLGPSPKHQGNFILTKIEDLDDDSSIVKS